MGAESDYTWVTPQDILILRFVRTVASSFDVEEVN